MNPTTVDTINAVIAITFVTWSLLGVVLWYFKRDSFLWLFPNADFVRSVPALAVLTTITYFIDLFPGQKIGLVINGLYFSAFLLAVIVPSVYNKLIDFRKNIVGNKIK